MYVCQYVLLEVTYYFLNASGTEDYTVDPSPAAEDSYDKSSPDTQDISSSSPHVTAAVEDTRYAATRRRRLLLMDDDDNSNNGEETA